MHSLITRGYHYISKMTAVRSIRPMSISIIVIRFCLMCSNLICCKFTVHIIEKTIEHIEIILKSDYEVNTRRIDEYRYSTLTLLEFV